MKQLLTALILVLALTLSGCGSNKADDTVKKGANDLISVTDDVQKEIEAGNEAKIKELGPKLEDVWSSFEDNVNKDYADYYEKIEESLNPEVAASKANPIDIKVVGKLNESLNKTLKELVQSIK